MHCGRNVGGSIPLPIISADFAQSLQAPSLRQQLRLYVTDISFFFFFFMKTKSRTVAKMNLSDKLKPLKI